MKISDRLEKLRQYNVPIRTSPYNGETIEGIPITEYDGGVEQIVDDEEFDSDQMVSKSSWQYQVLVAEVGKDKALEYTTHDVLATDRVVKMERRVILNRRLNLRYDFELPSLSYVRLAKESAQK